MSKSRLSIFLLIGLDVILILHLLTRGKTFALLDPQGFIALQEYAVIHLLFVISLLVVIPVFALTFFIAWKYKEGNSKHTYDPDKVNTIRFEVILWAIPITIVTLMSFVTWNMTHIVDPYKPIENGAKPIPIQVVALRWKWLFIYPQQHIATVNFLQIPVDTPISFELTADDAPMNSFWVPQLGGQMYAMTGMSSHLNLIADHTGTFNGTNAEISGSGFAEMKFQIKSVSQNEFDSWVKSIQASNQPLTIPTYDALLKPSENNPVTFYSLTPNNLYNTIVNKYMTPTRNK